MAGSGAWQGARKACSVRGRGGAKWARRVAEVLGDWGAGRDGQRQAGPSGKPCPLAPRADRCQRHGRLACSGEGGRASALGEACAPQALEQSVLQRPGHQASRFRESRSPAFANFS